METSYLRILQFLGENGYYARVEAEKVLLQELVNKGYVQIKCGTKNIFRITPDGENNLDRGRFDLYLLWIHRHFRLVRYLARGGRPNSNRLGYNARWRKARKMFLAAHPLCAVCGRSANEVDHIIPHEGDQVKFWDEENWQSLCKSDHSKKTAKERWGRNWK